MAGVKEVVVLVGDDRGLAHEDVAAFRSCMFVCVYVCIDRNKEGRKEGRKKGCKDASVEILSARAL